MFSEHSRAPASSSTAARQHSSKQDGNPVRCSLGKSWEHAGFFVAPTQSDASKCLKSLQVAGQIPQPDEQGFKSAEQRI